MIVYGILVDPNIWKPIGYGDNLNSSINGEPSCQPLFLIPIQSGFQLAIACLNVHLEIYWVNSRFGTPIMQILGLDFLMPQGNNLHIVLPIRNTADI